MHVKKDTEEVSTSPFPYSQVCFRKRALSTTEWRINFREESTEAEGGLHWGEALRERSDHGMPQREGGLCPGWAMGSCPQSVSDGRHEETKQPGALQVLQER